MDAIARRGAIVGDCYMAERQNAARTQLFNRPALAGSGIVAECAVANRPAANAIIAPPKSAELPLKLLPLIVSGSQDIIAPPRVAELLLKLLLLIVSVPRD